MALIPPTEHRHVPPSPQEQAHFAVEAAAIRAEFAARRNALKPAKRAVLAIGSPLRDIEAAVDCGCSCHPSPGDPDSHDGGLCRCQQTDAERGAARATLLSFFDGEDYEAERERDEHFAAELQAEAERLGVTATVKVPAAPFVITGVCDGRAFYLRERHGSWRVTIASDDHPLDDPRESSRDQTTIDIASGEDDDFNDESGHFSQAVALRVTVASVRDALLRNTCEHETPDNVEHRFCRRCGVALVDTDRWRWSTPVRADSTKQDLNDLRHEIGHGPH
jgi:hypothetical protein